jgi:hypothetical protein
MLLSRFWFLLLAALAGAGVAVAAVSTNLYNEREDDTVRVMLGRDRFELEMALRIEARAQIDSIAPLAAHGDVRSALREASGRAAGAEVPEAVATRLRTRLGELNTQLRGASGDLVFGVDRNGIIVAQVGGATPPHGAGLGGFPLVRAALEGSLRDDVWVYGGEVYRMAARPVADNGQFVGAIVHGKRIDDAFCQALVDGRIVGASLAFYFRDQLIASAMPATGGVRREDFGAPLATVLTAESFAAGEASEPAAVGVGSLAIYSAVVGEAAGAQVGYAIGRPVPALTGPLAIVELASGDDWSTVPWIPIAAAVVVLFLLGLAFSFLEHTRPLLKFKETAARLGRRDLDRFVPPEFGGALRVAAQSVNEALDKVQETSAHAPRRRAENLDEILGKASDAGPSPAFFGFSGDAAKSAPSIDMPVVPPAGAKPAAPSPPPVASPAAFSPPAKPGVPPPPAKPAAPPPPAAPPARPGLDQGGLGSTMIGVGVGGEGGGMVQASAAQATAKKPAAPVPPPPIDEDEDDGATMVARVPDELLRKSQSDAGAEETHFKEVFQQFLETKRSCGEPVVGLTYDKFVVTLRKNKEQIVAKHGAAKVRFTVYVKEGKAALKATPLKD